MGIAPLAFFVVFNTGRFVMAVIVAFIGVVLIWGSTPLAIQWSLDNLAFSFAVLARMVLGLVICVVALGVAHDRIPLSKRALMTYLAGGLGVFGAMSATYWSAQFIPSGWISVVFGVSPIVTGLLARMLLNEAFTPWRGLGATFGVAGLATIFARGMASGSDQAALGVAGVLCAVGVFATSTVAVKRLGAGVPSFAKTTGSLVVAVPCFALVWMADGGQSPDALTIKAAGAIVYLAVMGSVVGFVLFNLVLERLEASQTMLIPLLSPVVALALGAGLNGESLDGRFLAGAALILGGLAMFQWGGAGFGRGRG